MSEIIIYKAKDGHIALNVNLINETVWLSLNQMAALFGRDKSVVSRHLANIFETEELCKKETVANFATVQVEGSKSVNRNIEHYNLDAIISLGYRVNSKEGIFFRKWATTVLKKHLIKGYTLRKERLAERGVKELEQSIALLQKTLTQNKLINDIGAESIQFIMSYAKTWQVLLAYDEDELQLPKKGTNNESVPLNYEDACQAINALQQDLAARSEATTLFGQERQQAFQGILGNIEQTFDGQLLYQIAEERAAHVLYFIIKDHPFTDGNKRIGCLMFLLYLKLQNITIKINDNGLIALALLVAESDPKQKDLIIRLTVNLLVD